MSSTEYPIPVPRLKTEYSPNPFREERGKIMGENKDENEEEKSE
jgi:hypothetical protein